MPTIKLTDQFGLDVDVATGDLSSLAKYFGNFTSLSLAGFNLNSIAGLTLEDPAVTSIHAGLNFAQPVGIGSGGVTLQLSAGLGGTLGIFVPPADGGNLFDSDRYGDNIPVDGAERYVSIVLSATAGPGINAAVNQLCFGFQAGATVSLANYRLFETHPTAPSILAAVQDTLANFCVPGGLDDLRALAPGAMVTLEGTGTVSCSGSADLASVANPLATVKLPSPLPALDVSAGGSVTIAASFGITWDYQLRVRKLDANCVSLGFYRKRCTETSVSVDVHGGVSAGVGGQDLFSSLIAAVAKNAAVDPAALAGLGVPAAQIAGIQSAVKAAAQRKLEIAMLATLTATDSRGAAFLYEFDLDALDQDGTAALTAALRGDLSSLGGAALPSGVRVLRSIVNELHQSGVTWKLNLLGIYNYISISELVRQGAVLFEPVTGDLVVTDTATAKRVAAATVNFGADTAKLRHVLAESFLVTAVYRGSQTIVSTPEIQCSHSFFELNGATGADAMRSELDIAAALGLLDPGLEESFLAGAHDFGRTMVYAETSYDACLASGLFLNGTVPRPPAEFDAAGRQAIQLLVRRGAADDYRLRPATDDQLWSSMRSAGQPSFALLFPGWTELQIQVVTSDYSVIVWWADAMSSCAQRLAAMQARIAVNPDPETPQFQALREDLANHLANVASQTKEEFGQPWGLIAMDRVSGCRAAARIQIAGSRVALAATRATLAAAGGSVQP